MDQDLIEKEDVLDNIKILVDVKEVVEIVNVKPVKEEIIRVKEIIK